MSARGIAAGSLRKLRGVIRRFCCRRGEVLVAQRICRFDQKSADTFLSGRRAYLFALALSLFAHLGVGYLITASNGGEHAHAVGHASTKALSLYVQRTGGDSQLPPAVSRMPEKHSIHTQKGGSEEGIASPRHSMDSTAIVSIDQPVQPYYFHLSELTQQPGILHDDVSNLILRVPGLPPQSVILRLFINDQGEVDRVLVEDSYLSAEVERHVVEAFSKMRFQPGKIGEEFVRSQLRIEVRLESVEQRSSDSFLPKS